MILTLLKFLTAVTIKNEALSEWEIFSRQSLFGDQTFSPFDAMFDGLGSCLVKFERRQTFNETLYTFCSFKQCLIVFGRRTFSVCEGLKSSF